MRLYHFTKAANLLPIKERGLLPSVDEGMSHHPVVWLTTEPYPNMRVTIDGNRISVEPPENNLVRLTVEVPNDGRLFRYVTWPDRPKPRKWPRSTYKALEVTIFEYWYVYLGSIAPQLVTEIVPVVSDHSPTPANRRT